MNHPASCDCSLTTVQLLLQEKNYLAVLPLLEASLSNQELPADCQKTSFFLLDHLLYQFFSSPHLTPKEKKLFANFFTIKRLKKWLVNPLFSFFHSLLFNHLTAHHLVPLRAIFSFYLKSSHFSPFDKTFLLLYLQRQQSNYSLLVKKNDRSEVIFPQQLIFWKNLPFYSFLQEKIAKKLVRQDLAVAKITHQLLEKFFLFFYPWIPFQTNKLPLLVALTYQSCLLLNLKISWKSVIDWLDGEIDLATSQTILTTLEQKNFFKLANFLVSGEK